MTQRASLALPDQREFWDSWHQRHFAASHRDHALSSLQIFLEALPTHSRAPLLEIGCGQGREALHLADRGFEVTAFDHSPVAIALARRAALQIGAAVTFQVRDVLDDMPYAPRHFAGIFAHLSLHYFSEEQTRVLFLDLKDLLAPSGVFMFTVRAVDDPLFGRGEPVGPNMYCLDGHVRHFFDDSFIERLLSGWQVRSHEKYDTSDRTVNPGVFHRVLAQVSGASSDRPQ